MSYNWTWWKTTALSAAQAASHTISGGFLGDAVNIWTLDYRAILGLSAGAAFGSILRSIDTYKLPSQPAEAPAPEAAPVTLASAITEVGCAPGK